MAFPHVIYIWVIMSLSFSPDNIIEKQVQEGLIAPEIREKISFVLLRKHRHQTKKPIHRSLADIGKSSPSSELSLETSPVCVFNQMSSKTFLSSIYAFLTYLRFHFFLASILSLYLFNSFCLIWGLYQTAVQAPVLTLAQVFIALLRTCVLDRAEASANCVSLDFGYTNLFFIYTVSVYAGHLSSFPSLSPSHPMRNLIK